MSDYVSAGWNAASELTAKNLNQMETQYQHGKTHIDLHAHTSAHYRKTQSDAKFFPVVAGLDADKIDSLEASTIVGNQVVLGAIWLCKAADNEFTDGYLNAAPSWHQCDGSTINGIYCPDTRGLFPKCPSASDTTGTGGAATLTMSGTVTISNHTLTLDEIPSHAHRFSDLYYTGSVSVIDYGASHLCPGTTVSNVSRNTSNNRTGATDPHNHGTQNINLNAYQSYPPVEKLIILSARYNKA